MIKLIRWIFLIVMLFFGFVVYQGVDLTEFTRQFQNDGTSGERYGDGPAAVSPSRPDLTGYGTQSDSYVGAREPDYQPSECGNLSAYRDAANRALKVWRDSDYSEDAHGDYQYAKSAYDSMLNACSN
jgi:hypothetical protein